MGRKPREMQSSAKEIKITIVTDDEKTSMHSGRKESAGITVTHDSSMTLMSTLLKNGLIQGSFCGGRGDCGRCRIQFIEGVTIPTGLERSAMTAEELRQGYRLACLARPKDDCVIRLALAEEKKIDIISDVIDMPENNDLPGQQNLQSIKQIANVLDSMIAVDLGTTTIAMQLMEIGTGRILDTYCAMNPQRRYGTDVISRIRASCDGHRRELQQLALSVLKQGVIQFRSRDTRIRGMCIAGNTTMAHLLMGYDALSLGTSPFTPVELGLQSYSDPEWDFKVWITPGISAFVGGDIVAGLYALRLLPETGQAEEERAEGTESAEGAERRARILIDLGTNGEMAITDGRRMTVTAAAAGPAFEGGAGAGVIGSDMIANTAALLQRGILDDTGLMQEPWFSEGIAVGNPKVRIRSQDIRNLQMAKAAVRAGVEILWEHLGRPKIERVFLAGGFGYYLDVEAAFRISLLPGSMRGRVTAVGNASLAGAYRIGCDLLSGKTGGEKLEKQLSFIERINLAEQDAFEGLYVRYMNFTA